MKPIEALPLAIVEVQRYLNLVGDRWSDPTPNDGWDIQTLTAHLVSGSRMAATLIGGGTKEAAMSCFAPPVLGDDPLADFGAATAVELAGFLTAELDTIVPHPAMDMPLSMALEFRVSDYLLHAWDLARSLGANEMLNQDLVALVWENIQPRAALLPLTGMFGTGASENAPADASLQNRLLDLTGRRP